MPLALVFFDEIHEAINNPHKLSKHKKHLLFNEAAALAHQYISYISASDSEAHILFDEFILETDACLSMWQIMTDAEAKALLGSTLKGLLRLRSACGFKDPPLPFNS